MTRWFSLASVHKAQVSEVWRGPRRGLVLSELLGTLCSGPRAAPRPCLLEIEEVAGGGQGATKALGLADHFLGEMGSLAPSVLATFSAWLSGFAELDLHFQTERSPQLRVSCVFSCVCLV